MTSVYVLQRLGVRAELGDFPASSRGPSSTLLPSAYQSTIIGTGGSHATLPRHRRDRGADPQAGEATVGGEIRASSPSLGGASWRSSTGVFTLMAPSRRDTVSSADDSRQPCPGWLQPEPNSCTAYRSSNAGIGYRPGPSLAARLGRCDSHRKSATNHYRLLARRC
jgi:hypothetical protein